MDCSPKVKTVNIADVAIDNMATLPDYFLAERDVEDATTGNVVRTPVRVRSSDIFPGANNDNVIAVAINNSGITVPEGQVRAGYVENGVGANIMQYAGASHAAVFLMLGKHTDNLMRVQNAGFVNIPEGHRYIVDAQYYLGENGEPVTDASITGQKLFIPISETKLAINM
jgi:hypothetical protein